VIASRTLAVNAAFAPGAASPPTLRLKPISRAKAPLSPAFRRPRPCPPNHRPTLFRLLQARRSRRQSPLARVRHHQIAPASREHPRTKPRAAYESLKSRCRPRSRGLRVRPRPSRQRGRAPRRPIARSIRPSSHRRQQRKQVRLAHSSRRLS
jgi:hypothetical protein